MDEINPYATPGSALRPEVSVVRDKPRGYGWYKWCSLIYGALLVLVVVLAGSRGALNSAPLGLLVATIILAPLITYLLVAARMRRLFYSWLPFHLLHLLVLLAFTSDRVSAEDKFKFGFGLFLIGSSLLSWLASLYFHWRLGKK